jgi:hypothetical protein
MDGERNGREVIGLGGELVNRNWWVACPWFNKYLKQGGLVDAAMCGK